MDSSATSQHLADVRILITGSRDWVDFDMIRKSILEASKNEIAEFVTVVHGACPSGADAIADAIAKDTGMRTEAYAADWSKGRAAGPIRNAKMVNLGADVCLAFLSPCRKSSCWDKRIHYSHGATGCAKLASDAGIMTIRYYSENH